MNVIVDTFPGALGVAGLLSLAVALILKGKLVPRSLMEDLLRDKDAQIAVWQKACHDSEVARSNSMQQAIEMLEMARTTTRVVEAIQHPVAGGGAHDLADPAQPPQ